MKTVFILLDYKKRFGLKYNDHPYRSGMDKDLIVKEFSCLDYDVQFLSFPEVNVKDPKWRDAIVLYASQEDVNSYYKSYIEDVVYALELSGARPIPEFKFLRAHNNKVFMELLNDIYFGKGKTLKTFHFGTFEELQLSVHALQFPVVLKGYSGAMSRNVQLARTESELISHAKNLSRTRHPLRELKERGRNIKHKGYVEESRYRNKFVVQQFVEGLSSDWKVIAFGKKYYIFERPTRKNDFRASGSGNAFYRYAIDPPEGLLDFAKHYKEVLNVPTLSLDIFYDGKTFYAGEFQVIHFGTVGQCKSDGYFVEQDNGWVKKVETLTLEKVFVEGIVDHVREPAVEEVA